GHRRGFSNGMLGFNPGIHSLTFAGNGATLASVGADNTVRLWDAAGGKGLATLTGQHRPIGCAALSPDGQVLATGSTDGTIRLGTRAGGSFAERAALAKHTDAVGLLAFFADGKTLASAGLNGSVKFWDVATARERATLTADAAGATAPGLARTPDAKKLFAV